MEVAIPIESSFRVCLANAYNSGYEKTNASVLVLVTLYMPALYIIQVPNSAAAEAPVWDPLRPPPPTSPYGMDPFGPSWQWIFPRESGWPRLSKSIRIDQVDAIFQKMNSAGVRGARIATWWCMLEPERDLYNWQDVDHMFQIASNYGVEPIPEVFYTPDWAAGAPNDDECVNSGVRNVAPKDMDDWSDFMADFVGRYGANGKGQVHAWEIWNEPDLWEFLYLPGTPEKTHKAYAEMVKRTRVEMDSNDPGGLLLLLGGLSDINGPSFLGRVLDISGSNSIREDIGVITMHTFSRHDFKITKALGERDLEYDLWINELNHWDWDEDVSAERLSDLFSTLADLDIARTFWFQATTTDWGPGLFEERTPYWGQDPFVTGQFFEVFKNQANLHIPSSKPVVTGPTDHGLVAGQPLFSWRRPAQGTLPIAGYKLQVDDTLYRGKPYFHTPEIDAWVPGALTQFLPMQQSGNSQHNSETGVATRSVPTQIPSVEHRSYKLAQSLAAGIYYWRVAAVDTEGNVGPYTAARKLLVEAGKERFFLPLLAN